MHIVYVIAPGGEREDIADGEVTTIQEAFDRVDVMYRSQPCWGLEAPLGSEERDWQQWTELQS